MSSKLVSFVKSSLSNMQINLFIELRQFKKDFVSSYHFYRKPKENKTGKFSFLFRFFSIKPYFLLLLHCFNTKKKTEQKKFYKKIKKQRKYYILYNNIPFFFLKNSHKNYSLHTFYSFYEKTPKLLFELYSFFKPTILSLVVLILFFLFSVITTQVSFLRIASGWLLVGLFAYWLLSGFNFFLKRYRFGKFTTAMQRFWKRAIVCFWIVEGFLFSLFVYYLYNSSQEPTFMYDQIALYNFQLLPWGRFIVNSILVVVCINLILITILKVKNQTFFQTLPAVILVSVALLTILMNESYQFSYLVNFFDDSFWVFSEENNVWELEFDYPRTRAKNYYVSAIILAKFWHYIFIFASWVFFVMKSAEQNRIRYALLSMNVQNLVIFYIMAWSLMYGWFKWFFRRFLDKQYHWFFTSNRNITITVICQDFFQLFKNFFENLKINLNFFYKFKFYSDFFYITVSNTLTFERSSLIKFFFCPAI